MRSQRSLESGGATRRSVRTPGSCEAAVTASTGTALEMAVSNSNMIVSLDLQDVRSHDAGRVPREHAIFVGLHDPNRHGGAVRRDDGRLRAIALRLAGEAQKFQAGAD